MKTIFIQTPGTFEQITIELARPDICVVSIWDARSGTEQQVPVSKVRNYLRKNIPNKTLRGGDDLHELILSRLTPMFGTGW